MAKLTTAQKAVIEALRLAPKATRNSYELQDDTGYRGVRTHICRAKKQGVIIKTEYGPIKHGNCKHIGVASYTLISIPSELTGGGAC